MAVSITYSWQFIENLDLNTGPQQFAPDVTSLANGGFAGIGNYDGYIDGDIFNSDGARVAAWTINPGTNGALDQLSNGNLVIASQDNDFVLFRVVDSVTGNPVVFSTDLGPPGDQNDPGTDSDPDVGALTGGGFWIVRQANFGTASAIDASIFNNDGSFAHRFEIEGLVHNGVNYGATVAGLDNGAAVVAWTSELGLTSDEHVRYAVYDSVGNVISANDEVSSSFRQNGFTRNASVTAIDNGFAIAFEDEGWQGNTYDITLARFDLAGKWLGETNVSNPGQIDDGSNDTNPYVARLSNGMLAVAYTYVGSNVDVYDTIVKLINPTNGVILATRNVAGGVSLSDRVEHPTLAGFGDDGRVAVYQDDGHNNIVPGDINGEFLQAVRTFTASGAGATMQGINDGLGEIFLGTGGADTINGFNGVDAVVGDAGNDTLDGGAGADTLDGGVGDDTMYGRTGDDIYEVDSVGDVPIEALNEGTDRIDLYISWTLGASFENLVLYGFTNLSGTGNELANVLNGSGGSNALYGLGGSDRIYGYTGNDMIDGGTGDDQLDGGAGADDMRGGTGNDQYYVDDAADSVTDLPGEGDDRVFASVSFALPGGIGGFIEKLTTTDNDGTNPINLTGNNAVNTIFGNAGANTLDGLGGADTLVGLGGNDLYYVDDASDRAVEAAGGGSDRVLASVSFALEANSEIEVFKTTDDAGAGAINLSGNNFGNIIYGNAGSNTLDGGGGVDVMVGLGGSDVYIVDDASDRAVEAAGGGSDRVLAAVSFALEPSSEIELIKTTNDAGGGTINLTGNNFANILYGNAGGNTLDGGGGIDVMVGLGGSDVYMVDNAGDRAVEAAGGGSDRVLASVSFALEGSSEIEVIKATDDAGAGTINLTGNELANIIYGNAGGNTLDGGGGADIMLGLGGSDVYMVDNAGDRAVEAAGGGFDRVLASVSFALEAGSEIELIKTTNDAGAAAINLTGNELANIIYGNAGGNTLDGGGGGDLMLGLGGNDFFTVDNASDRVIETAGNGSDRVLASTSFTLEAGSEIEILKTADDAGTAAMVLTGNELANVILGNAGTNVIDGGPGNDTLWGLGGSDHFLFDTALNAATNVDAVRDFVVGTDFIRLENAIFATLAAGSLPTEAFRVGTAAADFDDRIIYNSATGAVLYDADGAGGAAAIQFASMTAGLAVTNADFIVV